MKNCCEQHGDCNQGRECPVRKGYTVRRCKAGQPVNDDLPITYWPGAEDDDTEDTNYIVITAVILTAALIALAIFGVRHFA